MNNDQRLIPFLGGLVIGGAAGNQTARYPYYYYPPYYGNAYYYPTQYVQQVPNTQSYYPYNQYQNGYYLPQNTSSNTMYEQRNSNDLSYVPIYKERKF